MTLGGQHVDPATDPGHRPRGVPEADCQPGMEPVGHLVSEDAGDELREVLRVVLSRNQALTHGPVER